MSIRLPHQLTPLGTGCTCTACGGHWKKPPLGGCLARQQPSALDQRRRPAPLCRQCAERPASHGGLCTDCHYDAVLRQRADIAAMISHDQIAVRAWAVQQLAQAQGPLFVATTGVFARDTAALIEVAVVDSDGDTRINTLIRSALPLPRWAQLRHRLTPSQVRTAPRAERIAPDLAETILWERVISWNSHASSALIATCLHATGHATPVSCWDELRPAYARYIGDWMPQARRYRSLGLPGRGPLALQCARAVLNAMRDMAGLDELDFPPAQRGRPLPLLDERDPDEDPDAWIE